MPALAAFEELKLWWPFTARLSSSLPLLQPCWYRHHDPQNPASNIDPFGRGSSTTGWQPLQR